MSAIFGDLLFRNALTALHAQTDAQAVPGIVDCSEPCRTTVWTCEPILVGGKPTPFIDAELMPCLDSIPPKDPYVSFRIPI